MTYIRNVYHIDGVTDLAVLVKQAEHRARHGASTRIHYHGAARACSDRCRLVAPPQEDQA